jgi:molybdate transport system substrate-binding protein
VAVRAGAPKIDIGSADGIRKALLAAKTIAYSSGPSGLHIARLIQQWGIADAVKSKVVPAPPNTPIGELVARGDAEIGFQQVSELLPVKGIDYLGVLPADIQEITTFSAGVHKAAAAPDAGRALLKFLTAPAAAPVIRKTGMEPG